MPGLAVVLVGEDPASVSYVTAKGKAAEEIGIFETTIRMAPDSSEEEILRQVDSLNRDERYNGFLVQLPLPKYVDSGKVINLISPDKDVDGFHPVNVGKMLRGEPCPLPCTPYGVVQLLVRGGYGPDGKHVVICGRSNIVGKPLAAMLIQKRKGANATVTVCHTATPDITRFTLQADILVAAMGVPRAIKAEMVPEGCVVIDVGVNRVPDATSRQGLPPRRRRRFRAHQGEGLGHHPGARRRRAHDGHDADDEHHRGRRAQGRPGALSRRGPAMKIGKIDETDFRSLVMGKFGRRDPSVLVPPMTGVDAGVVDLGRGRVLVVAEDPIFTMPRLPLEMFGRFTVHIGASDVAVMGIKPRYMTYSLLLPPETAREDIKRIIDAIHRAARGLGIAIVGGHTGYYPGFTAPTIGGITVFAVGRKKDIVTPAGPGPATRSS